MVVIEKSKKSSYGILCVTANKPHYILLNHSPSYSTTNILLKKKSRLNSQESYNTFLSSFPGYVDEGEYTLPRGKIDPIDQNNVTNTKIREFIEETKLYHPQFKNIVENNHNGNLPFYHFNDERYNVREEWVGLDGKRYSAEYTVFVINNREDLEPATKNTLYKFSFIKKAKAEDLKRYLYKYKYDSQIDDLKNPVFIPLEYGLQLLNLHRQKRFLNLEKKTIKNIITLHKQHQHYYYYKSLI